MDEVTDKKVCCDGTGEVGAGCYHDRCVGPLDAQTVAVIQAAAINELLEWSDTKMDLCLGSFKQKMVAKRGSILKNAGLL